MVCFYVKFKILIEAIFFQETDCSSCVKIILVFGRLLGLWFDMKSPSKPMLRPYSTAILISLAILSSSNFMSVFRKVS